MSAAAEAEPRPVISAPPTCPACGDTDTKPCRAVHAEGTSEVDTTTRGGAVTISNGSHLTPTIGSARTRGTIQTALAKACSPPPKRAASAWLVAGFIIGFVLAFMASWSCYMLGVSTTVDRIVAWTTLGACTIGGIALFFRGETWNQREWPKLDAVWRRRWVCTRCHGQFDRNGTPAVPGIFPVSAPVSPMPAASSGSAGEADEGSKLDVRGGSDVGQAPAAKREVYNPKLNARAVLLVVGGIIALLILIAVVSSILHLAAAPE